MGHSCRSGHTIEHGSMAPVDSNDYKTQVLTAGKLAYSGDNVERHRNISPRVQVTDM
jgi:hypothetical protein